MWRGIFEPERVNCIEPTSNARCGVPVEISQELAAWRGLTERGEPHVVLVREVHDLSTPREAQSKLPLVRKGGKVGATGRLENLIRREFRVCKDRGQVNSRCNSSRAVLTIIPRFSASLSLSVKNDQEEKIVEAMQPGD